MAERRFIDANNLIEEIREERCYNCRNFKDMKCDYCGTADYIYMIEDMPAADVAPVQEWISVEDRLPEVGGYVVCIAKENPFSRFMPIVARIKKNGWVNPMTEQYISEVTHWQPMPEPPEMGKMEE